MGKTTASSLASLSPARCRFFSGALSTGCTWLEFTHKPAGPEGPAGISAGFAAHQRDGGPRAYRHPAFTPGLDVVTPHQW
jgi:hypothetical protein